MAIMKMFQRVNGTVRIWLFWLVSRTVIILLIERPHFIRKLHEMSTPVGDVKLYAKWSKIIIGGSFPVHDTKWQYPPLAGVVMVAPRLSPLTYVHSFLLLALLMDALVVLLLLYRGNGRGGAWVWTAGVILLGSTVYFRYDLFVTVPAVAALLALPRTRVMGALAAVGAMLKVWPVVLMMGLPRDRRLISGGISFAAAVAATLAGTAVMGQGVFSFLTGQQNRGMEVEAIAVTPWQIARLFGWHATIRMRYGSFQFMVPGMHRVATACVIATLVGFALVAFMSWRRKPSTWTPALACDVALAATLVSIITSRVLSPQYLIWVIGIGAACLACKGSRQRPVVALILISALLSQYVYPFGFRALLHARADAITVLTVRNLILVTAAVLSIARLRSVSGGERGAAQTLGSDAVRASGPESRVGAQPSIGTAPV